MAPGPFSHTPEPSEELRRRLSEGDPEAIDSLAVSFFDDLVRYGIAILGDEERALEAVQETFVRVLERHRLFDPARPIRPWLFRVCRNCCLGLLKTEGRRSARVVDITPEAAELQIIENQVRPAIERLIEAESAEELSRALAKLPEEKSTIIFLHVLEGMTFREVAAVLGRAPAAVATSYYRALEELREWLRTPGDRAERKPHRAS